MKGLKALGGSFLINLSVGFGYAILISRVLGVENRGLVYSYQLPSLFIATLVFSIASQPVFELTKNTTNSRVSSITIALTLLSCSLFSLICCYLYWRVFNQDISFLYLVLVTVSQGFGLFFINFIKFNPSRKRFVISSMITPVSLLVITFSVFVVTSSLNVNSTILSIVIAYALSLITYVILSNNQIENKCLDEGVKSSVFYNRLLAIFTHKFLNVFSNYIDKLIVVTFYSPRLAGFIAVCMSLETVSSKLYTMLANYQLNSVSNRRDTKLETKKIYFTASVIGLIGILFSILLGELIITIMFGVEYSAASEYLALIISISIVNGLTWLISQDWLLAYSYKKIYIRQLCGLAIVVSGFVISNSYGFGIVGFLFAVLLANIFKFMYTFILKKGESF